jgi:hypothetical protein
MIFIYSNSQCIISRISNLFNRKWQNCQNFIDLISGWHLQQKMDSLSLEYQIILRNTSSDWVNLTSRLFLKQAIPYKTESPFNCLWKRREREGKWGSLSSVRRWSGKDSSIGGGKLLPIYKPLNVMSNWRHLWICEWLRYNSFQTTFDIFWKHHIFIRFKY